MWSLLTLALATLAFPSGAALRTAPPTAPTAEPLAMLALTVATDQAAYAPGATITARLTVINDAKDAVILGFSSSQRYDFAIETEAGETRWRWAGDRMFAQMLGEETLGPGKGLVYTERFPAPREPGRYRVVARLASRTPPASAAADFTVR